MSGHISLSAYEQVATSRFMCKDHQKQPDVTRKGHPPLSPVPHWCTAHTWHGRRRFTGRHFAHDVNCWLLGPVERRCRLQRRIRDHDMFPRRPRQSPRDTDQFEFQTCTISNFSALGDLLLTLYRCTALPIPIPFYTCVPSTCTARPTTIIMLSYDLPVTARPAHSSVSPSTTGALKHTCR